MTETKPEEQDSIDDEELWYPIPDEPGYEISNKQRVRSFKNRYGFKVGALTSTPRILKVQTHRLGYKYVTLRKDNKSRRGYIHILMARTFIPNPENKPEVNHCNGKKDDNRVENLEWATRPENMQHAIRTGLWDHKASLEKALENWRRKVYCYESEKIFDSVNDAAKEFDVTLSAITMCCQGKSHNVKDFHLCYLEDRQYLLDNIEKIKATEGGKKRVKAINIETGEERIYGTRKEASQDLGIPDSYISNIIAGRAKQTRGWTFEDMPIKLERGNTMEFINAFPGYEFKEIDGVYGKQNMYRGTNLGFGGYVYHEPGMYGNVALLDIQSLHPSSIISLNKFGKYTQKYKELKDLRIAIKEHDLDRARGMLGGSVAKYLSNEKDADNLAQAAKLILNSTYGFCSATFDNPFLDSRDKNNIVALKGSLFMRTLQDEVQQRGFTVAHIKTDSIKVPDATPEIIQFIMDFAKPYGYVFEFEGLYDKMCLVNGSTYIAKYASVEKCQEVYNFVPKENKKHPNTWTATAAQFQVPYVFKTLFSKEPIVFEDLCEVKEVSKGAIYLDFNENLPDVEQYEKEAAKLEDKYKEGKLSDFLFDELYGEMVTKINNGHDMHFVGRVGQFCPIKPGCGGSLLYRVHNGKTSAVVGTSGYRWLESAMVKELGKEDDIDISYYRNLVDKAVEAISKYGDFEWFVSDDPYNGYVPTTLPPDFMNIPEDADEEEGLPWED